MTDCDTKALDNSLKENAMSFLTSTQALQLHRSCDGVWKEGAMYLLDKKTTDVNDPLKVHVIELLDLLKNFHKVSVITMLAIAQKVWSVKESCNQAE
jgi:hypothetical protein